ncbi:CLUMA_CG019827, isoform A [Clunio marinus]|uniref:CLUMA_CG019827, isoform A n=1 Tax=Clunio marinus TaxID=568069 RepID=A0A1J1J6F2_9DIPT|nr:CLUMA_CG019827, isoform A [Clunio marinus]
MLRDTLVKIFRSNNLENISATNITTREIPKQTNFNEILKSSQIPCFIYSIIIIVVVVVSAGWKRLDIAYKQPTNCEKLIKFLYEDARCLLIDKYLLKENIYKESITPQMSLESSSLSKQSI